MSPIFQASTLVEKQPRLDDFPAANEGEVFIIGQLQKMHHGVKGRNLIGLDSAL